MFRAVLLSIVLSLAVGQNVALLCRAWCNAHVAAASGCHHEDSPTTPTVAGDESCDNLVVVATAGMYYLGTMHVLRGTLSLGSLLVFTAYLLMLYQPLESLTYTAWAMEGAELTTCGSDACVAGAT